MEVLRTYSRLPGPPSKLLERAATIDISRELPVSSRASRQRQLRFRMSEAELAQVAQEYRDGIGSTTLMKRYGLSKGSVLKVLTDHEVETRPQPSMMASEIEQAVALYAAGHSLAVIGKQLGWDDLTIRRALAQQGVTIRPRGRIRRA